MPVLRYRHRQVLAWEHFEWVTILLDEKHVRTACCPRMWKLRWGVDSDAQCLEKITKELRRC
jgi:hypothetical protein